MGCGEQTILAFCLACFDCFALFCFAFLPFFFFLISTPALPANRYGQKETKRCFTKAKQKHIMKGNLLYTDNPVKRVEIAIMLEEPRK